MSEDTSPLASLSLTHVYYDPTDPLSHLCAWLALLPQALCIVYVTLSLSTREAEVLLTFAGQLACEAANFLLKRLIKEARPARIPGKGYGMPSSHAQFVAFWSVSVALFLLVRYQPVPSPSSASHRRGVWPFVPRLVVSVVALVTAIAVAASRVYLSYHTPKQVCVGFAAGVVCAAGWFAITAALRAWGILDMLLKLEVARVFLLRDLVVEEDPCWAGWERWEGLVRGREKARGKGKKRN
ncbi:putative dolichyldiphosphatase [Scedosporium apiospermum]|uniref:Dolichyldiphosphatase n=1 Tax=Pseudallescheria apiosperma TaxID=563466 RepID=A0A084FVE7_PSEDA|nr:putative dolichyldiphosphatase [Scedosporium apiospermum]KEZ39059.1 putative dolichyldiphosphatase [Scedosporium apiospermum]